ncbi:hypothetical protein [Massilia sp. LjRoot122]|uniref:hypothetical protein n=1 Tax=Massilia sp. LjRoot122 TaxID=3342257 RepID=UPI003ECF827D
MAHQHAIPAFGKPLKTAEYYQMIDGIVNTLRPFSTLRTVANHLNSLGLRTPGDLEWHRLHVSNYIRQRGLNTNTNTN